MGKTVLGLETLELKPSYRVVSDRMNPGLLDGPQHFVSIDAARQWIADRHRGYMDGTEAANFPNYYITKCQDLEVWRAANAMPEISVS